MSKTIFLVVLVIRAIYAAVYLLSKSAFDHDINNYIFVFYRQAVATIFLIPFALFSEWKKAPPLSLWILCKIFIICFIGMTLSSVLQGFGLTKTIANLSAAIGNFLPAITFFLALIFRYRTSF